MQSLSKDRPAAGTIYVKFEDERAGNKYKDARLRGEHKQYVAITVKKINFLLLKKTM